MLTRTAIFMLAAAASASAQLCVPMRNALEKFQKSADANERRRILNELTDVGGFPACYVATFGLGDLVFRDLLARIEGLRMDKQPGAAGASSGSSSLVARGVTARAFSLAAESGGLTQSSKDQVVTFRGNLAGFPSVLARRNLFPYCLPELGNRQARACLDRSLLGQLRKASFGISFDGSRNETLTATPVSATPTTTPAPSATTPPTVAFTARRREISMLTARYEIWNKRDISSAAYRKKWEEKIAATKDIETLAKALTARLDPMLEKLDTFPEYTRWQTEAQQSVTSAPAARQEAVLAQEMARLASLLKDSGRISPADTREFLSLYTRFRFTGDEVVDLLGYKPVLAVDYTNDRPVGQFSTSNLRVVFDYAPAPGWSIALNGALTLYDRRIAEAGSQYKRLRDTQLAGQVERLLGDIPALGPVALSLSYYQQFQRSPAILKVDPANPFPGIRFVNLPPDARTVLAEKGNIRITQLRLTLGSGGSIRFPLAVSYSNRTELIKKATWRAQLGISYDFDSLFMR